MTDGPGKTRRSAQAGGGGAGGRAPLMGAGGPSPHPESVERLIGEFARLPGIGRRSAERMAFHVLKAEPAEAARLAQAIEDVKRNVRHCSACFNLTDTDPCAICGDERRDRATVLVVEQPRDLVALEQTGMYRGLYHVLMGRISPLDGVGPGHLTIDRLLERIAKPGSNIGGVAVREIVLGLNPTVEGDGTALYIAEQIRPMGVSVTRLARGVPSGAQLEHANKAVLADAIQGRQAVG